VSLTFLVNWSLYKEWSQLELLEYHISKYCLIIIVECKLNHLPFIIIFFITNFYILHRNLLVVSKMKFLLYISQMFLA